MFSLAQTLTSILNVNSKVPEKIFILLQELTPVLISYGQIWLLHKKSGLRKKWDWIMRWTDIHPKDDNYTTRVMW